MVGGTFEPCWKCDYLFNHTSGKVSRGTEVEDLCVKKIVFLSKIYYNHTVNLEFGGN